MLQKQKQGYPLYFKGDLVLLDYIELSLNTNIILPKPIPISVPFLPRVKQITPLLDPIIHLEVIDQPTGDLIIKGKYQLKSDVFYIYFPSQFRVDERIYKSLCKNYENILDEVPRNIRPNMAKLIIFQEGKGEHSFDLQKDKINESLSEMARQQIQNKLVSISSQIKQFQSQISTSKSLLHLFLLKNKLACLYTHLCLNVFAGDLLSDVWNQVMVNWRCLLNIPSVKGTSAKMEYPEDIPKSPYVFVNTNDILGYFENSNSTAYLRIVSHAFQKFFDFKIKTNDYLPAVTKLKNFIDFILNNVLVQTRRTDWSKQQTMLFDIARNIWTLEIGMKCLNDLQIVRKQNNLQRFDNEVSKVHVSLCSVLRNSLERIGLVIYEFDCYSIFPTTIAKQLQFVYSYIQKVKLPHKNTKKSIQSLPSVEDDEVPERANSFVRRKALLSDIPEIGPNQLKLKLLISQNLVPPESIIKILTNFKAFSEVYLDNLDRMYQSLSRSSFTRIGKSLKLTIERGSIMFCEVETQQTFIIKEPVFRKETWPNLYAIQKLYQIYFLFTNLTSGLNCIQDLCSQMVEVLKSECLQDEHGTIYQILSYIYEFIYSYGAQCKLSEIQSLELLEDNKIVVVMKGSGVCEFLQKSTCLFLITKQVMINEGDRSYKLTNIQIQSFKKVQQIDRKSLTSISEPSQVYCKLTAKIELDDQEQHTFNINSISVQKAVGDKKLILNVDVPKRMRKQIYHVNTAKINVAGQEESYVFSEVWTPFTFHLFNFTQATLLKKVEIRIVSEYIESEENISVKWPNQQKQTEQQQKSKTVSLSNQAYFSKNNEDKKENYLRIGQQTKYQIGAGEQKTTLTVFLKGEQSMGKIKRNSNRVQEQIQTHETLQVQVHLQIAKTKKNYILKCQTKQLILSPLLLVNYFSVQTYQQFSVTNLHRLPVCIKEDQHQYQLYEGEEIKMQERHFSIWPCLYPQLKMEVNFNDWFQSEYLLQQQDKTFKIWYKNSHRYVCFKPIQLQSQIVGQVSIPALEDCFTQGYEMIGKLEGVLERINETGLNLWLVPIKTGNIVLPEIWIAGKKGIWINSLITDVKQA